MNKRQETKTIKTKLFSIKNLTIVKRRSKFRQKMYSISALKWDTYANKTCGENIPFPQKTEYAQWYECTTDSLSRL